MKHKMTKGWVLAGVLVGLAGAAVAYPHNQVAEMATTQLYYVREMLATLLLFSIGFAALAVVILVLFLLDRGLYRVSAWTGTYTAKQLHQGWVQFDHFGRKQFHRL